MERPRDITGFRSRAINAGYAWTDANRPVAGDGASVRDVAGGRMVSLEPGARIPRPRPWDAVPFPDGGAYGVHLYTAPVIGPEGDALGYDPSAEGFSDLAAVASAAADNGPGEAPRRSISASNVADGWIVAEANEDFTAWRLALDPSRAGGERAIPVADLAVASGTLTSARALHSGAVDFLGFAGAGGGGGPDSDAVEVELDSSAGYTAHTDSWSYGATATVPVDPTDPNSDTVEKRTYPKFTPFRLYWWEAQHKLLAFHRKVTTNPDGQIVAVSAENPDTNPANSPVEVFTTVAEMP